jgi:hypothetical protein
MSLEEGRRVIPMYRSIESSQGEKIGSMEIVHGGVSADSNALKEIEAEVNGKEVHFTGSTFGKVDSIDLFGLPPFNEWEVGIEKVENLETKFSDGKIQETFRSEIISPSIASIHLERSKDDLDESYDIREAALPARKGIIGTFDIQSSIGECSIVLERDINNSRDEINRLRERLNEDEKEYLKDVRREERKPDVVVLKTMKIDGYAPAVKMELYPFWEKESYDNELVRCLEIGYLDYGDNETAFDRKHGKWYKLVSFEDFDHERLEIKEGNWQSREIEVSGEKRQTLDHYEKHLFKR